jgi:hypothetical protein
MSQVSDVSLADIVDVYQALGGDREVEEGRGVGEDVVGRVRII